MAFIPITASFIIQLDTFTLPVLFTVIPCHVLSKDLSVPLVRSSEPLTMIEELELNVLVPVMNNSPPGSTFIQALSFVYTPSKSINCLFAGMVIVLCITVFAKTIVSSTTAGIRCSSLSNFASPASISTHIELV